jgi:dTDP-4-dehydrorhamnose 3,5-epimerase
MATQNRTTSFPVYGHDTPEAGVLTSLTRVQIEALEIPDTYVVTPRQFRDDRGTFLEWFRGDELARVAGRPFAPVQANHSISRRGTLRGIHFADVPPGQAKYVYCTQGAILDVVVDVRVGSPTFGRHAAVRLDDQDRRGVFLAEGLGHGFVALTAEASVAYLVSTPYQPAIEHEIHPLDPELGLPWPTDGGEPLLSAKDAAAPTLRAAAEQGVLPSYDACRRLTGA